MVRSELEYKKHLTIFFDILGFATLVDQTADASRIHEILDKLRIVSSDLKKEMKRASFSDLVVLCTSQTTSKIGREPYTILNNIFEEVARIQAQLVAFNILVRGGITYDDLYIEDGFVFGKGLNIAYTLESKTANYPRIIIDPVVFDAYSSTYKNHQHIVSMDTDGTYYVDYLKYLTGNYHEYLSVEEHLLAHKSFIESNVQSIKKGVCSLTLKYAWLINKHNECISRLPENYSDHTKDKFKKLMIDSDVIRQLTTREI